MFACLNGVQGHYVKMGMDALVKRPCKNLSHDVVILVLPSHTLPPHSLLFLFPYHLIPSNRKKVK